MFGKNVVSFVIEVHSNLCDKELITVENYKWYFHEAEDLAFTFINPAIDAFITEKGKKFLNLYLSEDNLLKDKDYKVLDKVEEVLMVGYPRGLYDEHNNLPILRKSITASMIDKDYNGKKQGLLDIGIIYGSSGSPVFITKSYVNGQLRLANDYIKLLGINFSGETYEYSVEEKTSNSLYTKSFIGIAHYIKAECLLDFKDNFRQILGLQESSKGE